MNNGLLRITKFDYSVGLRLPTLNRYKLAYRIKSISIKFNIFLQRYFPEFVLKHLTDMDYCHNCKHVFEKKDLKKSVSGIAYCVKCPDHRNIGPVRAFVINFRTRGGKYTYTEGEYKYQQDFAAKNAKDLLQPTKYNNVSRKIETNPDFVKAYGNPFQEAQIGSEIEKDFESGEATFIEGDVDPTEFTENP